MFKHQVVEVNGQLLHDYVLISRDCENESFFLEESVFEIISHRPDVDAWYGDVVYRDHTDYNPTFDLFLQLTTGYVCLPLIVNRKLFNQLNQLNSKSTSDDYKLILSFLDLGAKIEHLSFFRVKKNIEKQLRSTEELYSSNKEYFTKNNIEMSKYCSGRNGLLKDFVDYPNVTLIIPTCRQTNDEGKMHIDVLLSSLASSWWPLDCLRLIIGDDVDDEGHYDQFRNIDIEFVHTTNNGQFNYAKKVNGLVSRSKSEYIIILNDDIEIVSQDWIHGLLTFLMREDVAGVGALLTYKNGLIQHAGMVGKEYGFLTHIFINQNPSETYNDWAEAQREYSMVTGAVFATKKSLYTSVGGLNEAYRLDYNDVDLCLRFKQLGYKIVYNGCVKLIHHESASRGKCSTPLSDTFDFLQTWSSYISCDPHYNSGLISKAE